MVGRFAPYKGIDLTCDALAEYWTRGGQRRFVVVGQGRVPSSLRRLRDRWPSLVSIDNAYISGERLHDVLSAAAICVMPYLSGTQSALPWLARAHGTHLIATDVGCIGEVGRRIGGRVVTPGLGRRARRRAARTAQPMDRCRPAADADLRRPRRSSARVVPDAQRSVMPPVWRAGDDRPADAVGRDDQAGIERARCVRTPPRRVERQDELVAPAARGSARCRTGSRSRRGRGLRRPILPRSRSRPVGSRGSRVASSTEAASMSMRIEQGALGSSVWALPSAETPSARGDDPRAFVHAPRRHRCRRSPAAGRSRRAGRRRRDARRRSGCAPRPRSWLTSRIARPSPRSPRSSRGIAAGTPHRRPRAPRRR